MADLKDVMGYILREYPSKLKDELSNARLTKMVYLSDWKHVLDHGSQITDIRWFFDNYGPFVHNVLDTATSHPELFGIRSSVNMYGSGKRVYYLKNKEKYYNISDNEAQSINHIIGITRKLYWDDFIRLVYSTYPIASSERYSHLDLPAKAKEYLAMKAS